jgi:hypothetical protein
VGKNRWQIQLADVAHGSNASVELSWHVGFTPDFGRMVATQELTLPAKVGSQLALARSGRQLL